MALWIVQIVAAGLFLAFFGALALAITMVGAIVTHVFMIGGSPAMAILLLAATTYVAWTRRPAHPFLPIG